MKCPVCFGKLRKVEGLSWDYTCLECGRGWKVVGKKWLSLFDADRYVFVHGRLIAYGEKALEHYREAGFEP